MLVLLLLLLLEFAVKIVRILFLESIEIMFLSIVLMLILLDFVENIVLDIFL